VPNRDISKLIYCLQQLQAQNLTLDDVRIVCKDGAVSDGILIGDEVKYVQFEISDVKK